MTYPNYLYGYSPYYTPQQVPDQLAQLRQSQMQQQMIQQPLPTQTVPVQPQAIQPPVPSSNPMSIGAQNNGIIWVQNKSEADTYLIAPNSAVALWDANNPVIYLRQADGTGKPTTKVYDLVERTNDVPNVQQPKIPQIDLSKFVTMEQLEDILAERLSRPNKPKKSKEEPTEHE